MSLGGAEKAGALLYRLVRFPPFFPVLLVKEMRFGLSRRGCVRVYAGFVFFVFLGGGRVLRVQRRFEAGLRVTDIVRNGESEMCMRWRAAENLKKKKKSFFVLYLNCLFKEVCLNAPTAPCAPSVFPHTRHRLSILFLYEKKILYPTIFHKLYQRYFFFN